MQCYLDVNSGANSVLIRVLIRATNLENTEPIEEPPLVLHLAAQGTSIAEQMRPSRMPKARAWDHIRIRSRLLS